MMFVWEPRPWIIESYSRSLGCGIYIAPSRCRGYCAPGNVITK
jgi:hypothetical protein